ncbi:baseplate J/gp47 family protein [Streptosporangium sp. NPDC023825]|uniref:baseplate J/gp47 family protein n=1 Tax=Streptosporangium sp. NPDC023825 TaxID=3154909 RepID=UPI00344693AD
MAEIIPVDYTAAEYGDIRADLLRRAAVLIPEWTSRSEADFGVMFTELFSHAADLNNYAIDRMLRESFLPSALTSESIMTLAAMLGYIPHGSIAATGTVTLITDTDQATDVVVPAGTQLSSVYVDAVDGPVIYETVTEVTVPAEGGTVVVDIAEGRTTVREQIGVSTGREAQRVAIRQPGVIEGSVHVYVEAEHADLEWTYLTRLAYAAQGDLAYTLRPTASGITMVCFGDGVNGAVPEIGARIYATYRVGVGKAGNLAANKIEFLDTDIPGVTVAYDGEGKAISSAVTGGTGPEDIEQVRRHAPSASIARERAVTVTDYAAVALTVPGVSAAKAVSQVASSVIVYIAGPERTLPSTELIEAAQAQLDDAAMAGVTVTVGGPTLIGVNLGTELLPMRVYAAPTWRNSVVEQQVRTTLAATIKNASISFGSRVTVGAIYTAVAQLPGVINVNIPMMARSDATQSGIDDIVLSPWELPVLGTVALTTTGGVSQ